jgi:uncharacterized membrane protein YeaQ/YmgE (transglycosylase-associated protein family)
VALSCAQQASLQPEAIYTILVAVLGAVILTAIVRAFKTA